MIYEIKHLNPKPGLAFTHSVSETLIPDVIVKKNCQTRLAR